MKIFIPKIAHFATWLIIITMFGLIGFNSYQQFKPIKILVLNEPTTMVKSVYHPGDVLDWRVNVTHYTTGVKATVTREVDCITSTGKHIVGLPTTNFITKAGTTEFIQSSFILSLSTPPGKCKVLIDGIYYISQTRTIYFHDETNEFQVIEGKIE